MKTDAERMALIRQRTAQLQRQARARQMLLIDAGCMAACLALVVCLGLAMPGWAGTSVALHVSPTGTAGMLSERGADGYILVGVLSFLLGSCVTILLYRLHRHGGDSGGLHGAARHLQSADHRRRLLADGRVLLSFCHHRHPVCGKAAPQGQAHCFSLTVSRSFPEREIFLNFFQIWVKGIGANCIIGDREDGKQPL